MPNESITQQTDLKEQCFQIRDALLPFERLRGLANEFPDAPPEAKANLMLAFRHLEDCRMRLGKVVQALDGGKSAYPR